jgi:serine-type D-Ala-D-Ala carboxypeptidase (penicillin-binding protein 5/6)
VRRLPLAFAAAVALSGATAPAMAAVPDTTVPVSATSIAPATTAPPTVAAEAWILVDADTGAVLAGESIHEARLPASTVKVVTALTALRLNGAGGSVQVTTAAASRAPMRIGMQVGQQWSMKDALYSLMLVSANDSAYAIAQSTAGSIEGFSSEMAETGQLLGLRDSTFKDPAGFDDADSVIGPSEMSPFDLAIVGRAALRDATLGPIVATQRYKFTGPDGTHHTLVNHSKLLTRYDGADGIKTGYTKRAQGTFVGSATRGGRTLIAVVLGAPDIYTPVIGLFDWGFSNPPGSVGTGENLPAIAGEELVAPPPAASVAITAATDTTIPLAPVTTAAMPITAVPITAVPVTAPVLLTGTTGPVWWAVGVSGGAALIAAIGVWRFAVSKQRRRRYDRVLGRVADLRLPARS